MEMEQLINLGVAIIFVGVIVVFVGMIQAAKDPNSNIGIPSV